MAESTISRATTRVIPVIAPIHVGIAELGCSDDPMSKLDTFALGSCLGVTLHDPVAGVAALLHAMLPSGSIDEARASRRPATFVDRGIAAMLDEILRRGAQRQRLVAVIAGGAQLTAGLEHLQIGAQNCTQAAIELDRHRVPIRHRHTGGQVSRSMAIEVATGTVRINVLGKEVIL